MNYLVDANHIFTFFFIMLGPVKLIVPYAHATQGMTPYELRRLSLRAVLAGTLIALAGAGAGCFLLKNWAIPAPMLILAAGIILFIVALGAVLPSPAAASAPVPAAPPKPPEVMQVVFPMLLTPYGIAVLIVFLASSHDTHRMGVIVALLLANMVLNYLAMVYVRPILRAITPTGMQIIFSVLGVLMVALALQITVAALGIMHIIEAPL